MKKIIKSLLLLLSVSLLLGAFDTGLENLTSVEIQSENNLPSNQENSDYTINSKADSKNSDSIEYRTKP